MQRGDHAAALGLHRKMLRLWNAIFADNRVATAKFALSLQGAPTGISRRPTPPVTPAQQAAIRAAIAALNTPVAAVAQRSCGLRTVCFAIDAQLSGGARLAENLSNTLQGEVDGHPIQKVG